MSFVVEKVALAQVLLRVLRFFPCHCNFSSAPYSYSCTRGFYQKDKREMPGKLSQSEAVS